jgi:hypothetical protein
VKPPSLFRRSLHALGWIKARSRAGILDTPPPSHQQVYHHYYHYYYYYYYCPGLLYVASPALRIASTPSSALSSWVVFSDFKCPGLMAAMSVAAAVPSSGASKMMSPSY